MTADNFMIEILILVFLDFCVIYLLVGCLFCRI